MSVRALPKAMRAYRIGDPAGVWPIMSGEGARLAPGRWNEAGQGMIYASEHYSTAMLEKLVRLGDMPPNQHFVEIHIEKGVSYEVFAEAKAPLWFEANQAQAKAFGGAWFAQARSAILLVPSVAARLEKNVLINTEHADFAQIRAGLETPIWWDARLFAA